MTENKRLQGKLALITGASRGIGAAVAKRFADEGSDLILVARGVSGLEEVDDYAQSVGSKCLLVPCDLLDYAKIDEIGKAVAERYGKLDILVGNAGMLGVIMPTQQVPPQVWHDVIGLNLNVNWHLIRAFDPLLRQSQAGRAIFVSSSDPAEPSAYWAAYAASKAALESLVGSYAEEIKNTTNIKVNLVYPGAVNTAMLAQAFMGRDLSSYPSPESITDTFVDLSLDSCKFHGEKIEIQK